MSTLAEYYNNSSKSIQSLSGGKLLGRLPFQIQNGLKVADIGCGTGILALEISRIVGKSGLVLALDPNKRRIDYLKQQPEAQAENLVILNDGAENVELKNYGQFDLVFSNLVMHWVPEDKLKTIFQSVFDGLKPGGHFAIAVAEMVEDEGGYRAMFHTHLPKSAKEKLFNHVFVRSIDWYVNLATSVGFKILDSGYMYQTITYKNVDDFLEKLGGTFENILPFEEYFDLSTIKEAGFYQVKEDGSLVNTDTRFSFFIAQKN